MTAAAYIAATLRGQQLRPKILCEKLPVISQRFLGIPPSRFDALAEGMKKILSRCRTALPVESPPKLWLELLPDWEA